MQSPNHVYSSMTQNIYFEVITNKLSSQQNKCSNSNVLAIS